MYKLITTTIFVLVTIIGTTYFYEKYRPATDYFNYYGDVTTKRDYTAPEPILSIAFGRNKALQAPDILFRNELYCKPYEANGQFQLISVDAIEAKDYVYWNPINPAKLSRGMLNNERFQVISRTLEDVIRKDFTEKAEYGTWKLNNDLPTGNSSCRIESYGTVKTPIFGFDKTVASTGNEFNYFVE